MATPVVYKVYCSLLNDRLTTWSESNNLISEEQNCFWKGRSTINYNYQFFDAYDLNKEKS